MKKTILLLLAVVTVSFVSCKNNKASDKVADNNNATTQEMAANDANANAAVQQNDANKKYPKITFEDANFDFGKVTEGEVVQHKFVFTNTGEAPLKVMKADPSCGCTVPTWSREAIAPGEQGSMVVKFNSRGQHGVVRKSVRLTTNTKEGVELLRFTANVVPKS